MGFVPFASPLIITAAAEPLLPPRSGECRLGLPVLVSEVCDPDRESVGARQAGAVAAAR
jgi:hypothetical protein